MDRDDFLELFEGLAGDTQLDTKSDKTNKDWIGWLFLFIASALVAFAGIALIWTIVQQYNSTS